MNIKKLMIVLLSLIVFMLYGFYWVFIKDAIATKKTAEQFLTSLTNQDFENAFKHVDYYESASDLPPTIDYEHAKTYWIDKVHKLKKRGIVLKAYKGLETVMDDNYPKGTVELTIDLNKGYSTKNYNIYFTKLRGEWRVSSIQGEERKDLINTADFEEAVSGYIPIPRSIP